MLLNLQMNKISPKSLILSPMSNLFMFFGAPGEITLRLKAKYEKIVKPLTLNFEL